MADNRSFYCEKCNRTMSAEQFYGSNNLDKYPDGKLKQCKKCISMHVDNFNPDTYLWILQECDVPYIPDEWNKLLASYGKDKSKLTGMTILGRYLSKMKLKQFRDYRWKDTQHLQEVAQKRLEEAMKAQGYDAVEIAAAKEKAQLPSQVQEGEILVEPEHKQVVKEDDYFGSTQSEDDYFARQGQYIEDDAIGELTEEEKIHYTLVLCMKNYFRLENLYILTENTKKIKYIVYTFK